MLRFCAYIVDTKMYTRCSLCGEDTHNMMRCPMLVDPLQPGFSGAGGGGGGGHDHDEDEHLDLLGLDLLRKQLHLPRTLLVERELEDRGTRNLNIGSIKRHRNYVPRAVLH